MTTLAVGPLNTASQAVAWSEAISARGLPAFAFRFNDTLAQLRRRPRITDGSVTPVPDYRLAPAWYRRAAVRNLVRDHSVTHLLNESNVPVFSRPVRSRFVDELPRWRRWDVKAGILFHGSDARDPDLSMELSDHSFFHDATPEWVEVLRQRSAINRRSAEESGVPLYVSTPDMLAHVPEATLLPLTVNVHQWRTQNIALERPIPRVLHRPSGSNSPTKGSSYIAPVLDELERAGRIEVIRSGVVSRRVMARMITESDIVVDQLQAGSYGLTAIEAMASARLVVADISTLTRETLGDVPIIDATPSTFVQALDRILENRDESRALAAAGPLFVRQWHDGRKAFDVLKEFVQ